MKCEKWKVSIATCFAFNALTGMMLGSAHATTLPQTKDCTAVVQQEQITGDEDIKLVGLAYAGASALIGVGCVGIGLAECRRRNRLG